MGALPILLPQTEQPSCQLLIRVRHSPCRRSTRRPHGRQRDWLYEVNFGRVLSGASPPAWGTVSKRPMVPPDDVTQHLFRFRNSGAGGQSSLDRVMAFLAIRPAAPAHFPCPGRGVVADRGSGKVFMPCVTACPSRGQDVIYEYALIPARYSHAFAASQTGLIASWSGDSPGTGHSLCSGMGLHNDLTHLVINSLWLLALCGPVVRRGGWGRCCFWFSFWSAGWPGRWSISPSTGAAPVPVIGASGAISRLMAAALRMLPGQASWAEPRLRPAGSDFVAPDPDLHGWCGPPSTSWPG